MNGEKLKVTARLLFIGKTHVGNALSLFSVVLRLGVRALSALLFLRFENLFPSLSGRVLLGFGVLGVAFGALLCECTRTVRDRWYGSVCDSENKSVIELITDFSFADFLLTLKNRALSAAFMVTRAVVYFSFPLAILAFSLNFLSRGVSLHLVAVIAAGNLLLLLLSALFFFASFNCISLARTLSCNGAKGYVSRLRALERRSFGLLSYSALLSVFNRGYRCVAKLLFARSVVGETVGT